jgi:hypothetical protein
LLVITGIGCKLDEKSGLPLLDGRKRPENMHHAIHAFDPRTGTRRWNDTPPTGVTFEYLVLDPTATRLYVKYGLNAKSTTCELLDAHTGARLSSVPPLADLGPEARLWAGERVLLQERGREKPLVTLDPDEIRSSLANAFSADGRLVTFGTREGTVLVFDLDEAQRQLATVGLGW